jgi:hypothetical protein
MADQRAFGNTLRLWCATLVVLLGCGTSRDPSRVTPAVPIDPISGLLDAFQSHRLVALDEGDHGNNRGHAFRLDLVRDPRFGAVVDDIVVEFGSARYQTLMDRFVVAGEDVPPESLRVVWQDTTQPHDIWDGPIYEEFFRTVREVNASRPQERRVRVLLGDPPIAWEAVRSRADHAKWFEQRDSFPAKLIQQEVLAKNRRALLVFGSMHLVRHVIGINYSESDQPWAQPLTKLLERGPTTTVFTVWSNTFTDMDAIQPDVREWPVPSLALLQGTTLGAADFTDYYPFQTERGEVRDGEYVPITRAEWRQMPMEQQFDAVLYLGPPSTLTKSRVTPALCADSEYRAMRRDRMRRTEMPPEMDGLTPYCEAISAP